MDELFQIDWRIFMAGADAWVHGRNPYGVLSSEFGAGAFAYPPTALPWLALFLLLGGMGYYVWTALQLAGWWYLVRRDNRWQLILLAWSPMLLHLVEGQSTFAAILVAWAATKAARRGWVWGLAMAWAITKPQAALLPLLWLFWHDRNAPERWRFVGGVLLGTVALALPATLMNPAIWHDWIIGLGSYRERILQMAAWQGPSVLLLLLAAYLWHRSRYNGWQWWFTAALFPQTSYYAMVALMPAFQLRRSYWTLGGIGLASALLIAPTPTTLPWLLAAHMVAAWLVAGGPRAQAVATPARDTVPAGK